MTTKINHIINAADTQITSNPFEVFNHPDFGFVRVVMKDGEPWLVGKDVAETLGYSRPVEATRKHTDMDDTLFWRITDSLGREQETLIINESGLYSLILRSKLSQARQFKRWVTSEVLPSIREHGGYLTPDTL